MSMREMVQEYWGYVGKDEAPRQYHTWCFLAAVSASLGRRSYYAQGHFRIFPNTFIMLMGDPGARKSTAIGIAKDLLVVSGFKEFASMHAGHDRFLEDLENSGFLGEGAQQFICADEFMNFLGENNSKFCGTLMELYDAKETFEVRLRGKTKNVVMGPCVGMLAGNNHQNFGTCFSPNIIHNGFLSRMILVWGQRGSKVPNPIPPADDARYRLAAFLEGIRERPVGPLGVTPQAKDALTEIYNKWEDLEDGRFQTYGQRRQVHLIKLALICSAGVGKMAIDYEDVLFANTLLHTTELEFPKALGEFGKSKTAEEASAVMNVLYNAAGPVALPQLWNAVSTSLAKFEDLRNLLHGLIAAKKVDNLDGMFFARIPAPREIPHTDMRLLA